MTAKFNTGDVIVATAGNGYEIKPGHPGRVAEPGVFSEVIGEYGYDVVFYGLSGNEYGYENLFMFESEIEKAAPSK